MKKILGDCIIVLIFFLIILTLTGCAKKEPVSETIADNAINATTGLEQQLPEQCKTSAITTQLTLIKTQIRSISNACETEKQVIEQQRRGWKMSFWALIGLIIAYIFKRLTK